MLRLTREPSISRRAAANITHGTVEFSGADGLLPNKKFSTESRPPVVKATTAGAVGTTEAAEGVTLAAAVTAGATTDSGTTSVFADISREVRTSLAAVTRGRAGADSGSFVTELESPTGIAAAGATVCWVVLRAATDPETVGTLAEPEALVADRPPRLRTDGRGACAAADAAPPEESEVEESAGVAQAVAAPLTVTATPIPNATARPPKRPACADARIFNVPPDTGAQQSL